MAVKSNGSGWCMRQHACLFLMCQVIQSATMPQELRTDPNSRAVTFRAAAALWMWGEDAIPFPRIARQLALPTRLPQPESGWGFQVLFKLRTRVPPLHPLQRWDRTLLAFTRQRPSNTPPLTRRVPSRTSHQTGTLAASSSANTYMTDQIGIGLSGEHPCQASLRRRRSLTGTHRLS
jgi:hypothetical protein